MGRPPRRNPATADQMAEALRLAAQRREELLERERRRKRRQTCLAYARRIQNWHRRHV